MLRAYGYTDKGGVRPANEDCFGIDDQLRLCVIADGMGGHAAGEIAARIAVDAVTRYVRSAGSTPCQAADVAGWPFGFEPSLGAAANLLRTAIYIANAQILETAGAVEEYAGMGTTIVATMLCGDRLAVGHVGDSRLYLYDARGLRQITADDSWMASVLAQDPLVDRALLMQHPMRNALTNVVGARPGADVHVMEETLAGGELLVLTTDGVHGTLDQEGIERVLVAGGDPAAMAGTLVERALKLGSRDNCTAVVAHYTREGRAETDYST